MTRNLILGVLVAAATFGCATPQNSALDTEAAKSMKAASLARQHCIRDTGSRIERKDDGCSNQPGSSYSQDELQNTGRIDTADALRQLDPRLQ
jgi:hypothetical protein